MLMFRGKAHTDPHLDSKRAFSTTELKVISHLDKFTIALALDHFPNHHPSYTEIGATYQYLLLAQCI